MNYDSFEGSFKQLSKSGQAPISVAAGQRHARQPAKRKKRTVITGPTHKTTETLLPQPQRHSLLEFNLLLPAKLCTDSSKETGTGHCSPCRASSLKQQSPPSIGSYRALAEKTKHTRTPPRRSPDFSNLSTQQKLVKNPIYEFSQIDEHLPPPCRTPTSSAAQ